MKISQSRLTRLVLLCVVFSLLVLQLFLTVSIQRQPVSMTDRGTTILDAPLRPILPDDQEENFNPSATSRPSATSKKTIQVSIFMNAFFPSDPTSAFDILNEQIRQIEQSHVATLQNTTIHITTIGNDTRVGHICQNAATVRCVHDGHVKQGGETDTLFRLYEYCQTRPSYNQKVVYIHNKGSFHQSRANTRWRHAMMAAVTHPDCVQPPNHTCNACGLIFSAPPRMPTLLFPGNFFVASCDYVNQLHPPKHFGSKMESILNMLRLSIRADRLSCRLKDRLPWNLGMDRYSPEHWIGSHPGVAPCDLSKEDDYWYWLGHKHRQEEFEWAMFPRRAFNETRDWNDGDAIVQDNPDLRLRDYFLLPGLLFRWIHLYGMTPAASSWIWSWFPDAPFWKDALDRYGNDAVNVVTAPGFHRNGSVVK